MKAKFFTWPLAFLLLIPGVQAGVARAQDKTYTNSLGMEFVLIPAGSFMMGSAQGDSDEQPVHKVTIGKPFYLGKYEVTQEQWEAVMGEGSNPSKLKSRTNPVERVSWDDAQEFIQKLNEKEGGQKYRLPTEAEWEHAARAGSDAEYFFGNDPAALGEYAWFEDNSQDSSQPVGQKKPNPWGLYDIYGNVWEWVQDWHAKFQAETATDPTGPASGSSRVVRGSSYLDSAEECRSAYRYNFSPDFSFGHIGFRLALSPGQ